MFIFFGMIADDQAESGIPHMIKTYLVSPKENVFYVNIYNHVDRITSNRVASQVGGVRRNVLILLIGRLIFARRGEVALSTLWLSMQKIKAALDPTGTGTLRAKV